MMESDGTTVPMIGSRRARAESPLQIHTVADVIACAGLQGHELTPKVMRGFATLMAEIRRLRQNCAAAERRAAELEAQLTADHGLPVLGRDAFAACAARLASAGGMIELRVMVAGLDRINHRHGDAAGDAVLARVAERLVVLAGDQGVVGRLAGARFAVLLPAADAVAFDRDLLAGLSSDLRQFAAAGLAVTVRPATTETPAPADEDAPVA